MATTSSFLESKADLRGPATEHNRDINNRAKWHPNWTYWQAPNTKVIREITDLNGRVTQQGNKIRPIGPPVSQRGQAVDRASNAKQHRKLQNLRKQSTVDVVVEDDDAWSPSEESRPGLGSRVPSVDLGITYSFDAPRGPSQGSEILSVALTQAEAKFEDRQTTKLVNEEYEVLNTPTSELGFVGLHSISYAEDEEDFELI